MNNEIIKEKIISQIEVIIEQIKHIDSYNAVIPRIEIDLALENIRRLYEQFQELNHSNTVLKAQLKKTEIKEPITQIKKTTNEQLISSCNKDIDKKEIILPKNDITKTVNIESTPNNNEEGKTSEYRDEKSEKIQITEDITVKKQETVIEVLPDKPLIAFENKEKNTSIKQAITETSKQTEQQPYRDPLTIDMFQEESSSAKASKKIEESTETLPLTQEKEPQKTNNNNKEEKATIADKFHSNGKSLSDHLMEIQNKSSVGSKMQKHPISDLKIAIGINEKFLFINELFKGSVKAYNDFILEMNEISSLENATETINKNKAQYNWTETSHAYTTLMSFIERKFS